MKKKEFFIAGNWKMYKTIAESRQFIEELEKNDRLFVPDVKVVVFAPFPSLPALKETARHVRIGGQNLFYKKEGAYTGEVSALMLQGIAEYVLVGHSERRTIFGESDETVNLKVKAALAGGLSPVLCIGETLEERDRGETFKRMGEQLDKGLRDLTNEEMGHITFAYEPVWAIGTGRNATPEQAQEAHFFIRQTLSARISGNDRLTILYGGSAKPENSFDLLSRPDVDGLLIGGASLKVESFSAIILSAVKLQNQ